MTSLTARTARTVFHVDYNITFGEGFAAFPIFIEPFVSASDSVLQMESGEDIFMEAAEIEAHRLTASRTGPASFVVTGFTT